MSSPISLPSGKAQLRDLTQEQLARTNIGRRYWGATIAKIPEGDHKDLVTRYVQDIEKMRRTGWGLFLWGANSQGKTFAATAILKEAVKAGFTAYAVLTDVLKSAFIDGSRFDTDQSIVDRVRTVEFLLLEDVGKEYSGKGSGWAELCLENLLRSRSRELLVTLVTTNLDPKEFQARYERSSMAMVMECMVAQEVSGPDFRRQAATRILTQLTE